VLTRMLRGASYAANALTSCGRASNPINARSGPTNGPNFTETYSTTLTRTLRLLLKQGWVRVRRGRDRRERLFSLTRAGMRKMSEAQPYWERAERRLRQGLGDAGWKSMKEMASQMTEAAVAV
jgi:DNA-binding PadR family transcriptional regulator